MDDGGLGGRIVVSTHSRLKAAGLRMVTGVEQLEFQHTAA